MATYYNFEIWDSCEMESSDKRLYEDFDELCDVADEILTKRNGKFIKPNRKAIKEKLNACPAYHVWYTHQENAPSYDTRIYINQMKAVPKKKYPVYYYKAVSANGQVMKSQEFSSFDEVYKLLEQTVRNNECENYFDWKPPMTREETEQLLEKELSIEYARFDNQGNGIKVYDLYKKMV